MDLSRQEYPGMLATLPPIQAVDVLNNRVREVGRLNSDIAEWLNERRRLEEQYSSGLRKLARRPPPGSETELGVFSVPWSTLTNALEAIADSHHLLSQKINIDVERPLREFATKNREMQAMATIQGNLQSMANDIEKAQRQSEKLKDKGNKAATGKVANASSDLENAQSQWESQAPYVFEQLQALDETRLNHLRDVLTQFQTHEVDQVERNRVAAEQCLNVLLNVETADEIKTFALRTTSGRPRAERQRSRQSSVPTPSTPSARAAPPSPAIPTPQSDDRASERSASVSETPASASTSRVKGLKRLGTVLGRRRESKQMLPSNDVSEHRKSRFGLSSMSNRHGKSRELAPTLEAPESPQERPRSPLRTMSSISSHPTDDFSPPPGPPPQQREQPTVNGTSSAAQNQLPPISIPNGSHQNDLTDLQGAFQPSQPEPQEVPIRETPRDAEGYSMPPPSTDPISQAQQEAAEADASTGQFKVAIKDAPAAQDAGDADALAAVANSLKMQAPPPTTRRTGTVRGRRDGRNSMYGPSFENPTPPLAEKLETPREVPESPQPIVTQPPPAAVFPPPVSPPAASPTFPSGGLRTSTFSPFPASSPTGQLPPRPVSRAIGDDHFASDAGSIRSGRSLSSSLSQANKHPDLHEPGLGSSVLETVTAKFEDGQIVRSLVIGEVALAYNPTDYNFSSGSETIRLENFHALEKVAPNPAFISAAPDKQGEYTVALGNIAKTAVAFKYQVSAAVSSAQAPLLIHPQWKMEPTQSSVIVAYSLNPAFAMHARDSITLSNVTLILHLEGAKATGCQSRPSGTFVREKNLVAWQLGDVTLTPGAAPTKLLARFLTDGQASKGHVEAKWEVVGDMARGFGSGLAVSVQAQKEGGGEADPFADEGLVATWREVQGVKKVASGTYTASG